MAGLPAVEGMALREAGEHRGRYASEATGMTLLTAVAIVLFVSLSVLYLVVVFDGYFERRESRRRNP